MDVWPENHDVWEVWCALDTQWRLLVGQKAIATLGLDYPAAQAAMRMMGIRKRDRRRVFEGLREMELEALTVMNAEVGK